MQNLPFASQNVFTCQLQHQGSAGAKEQPNTKGARARAGKGWIEDDFIVSVFCLSLGKKSFQSSFLSGRRLVHNLVSEHLFPSLGLVLKVDDNALLKAH